MPGVLVLSLNQSVLGEFPLDKERIVIGRKPDNDIQVDNLAVSGQHAAIITILNDSFLEDLDSTNGTYVNGKLIKKHALKHGDVVTIGKHELKYLNDEASGDESDFEKTMIIRPGMASHAAAAAKAEEQAPASPAASGTSAGDGGMPLGKIQVLSGPGSCRGACRPTRRPRRAHPRRARGAPAPRLSPPRRRDWPCPGG